MHILLKLIIYTIITMSCTYQSQSCTADTSGNTCSGGCCWTINCSSAGYTSSTCGASTDCVNPAAAVTGNSGICFLDSTGAVCTSVCCFTGPSNVCYMDNTMCLPPDGPLSDNAKIGVSIGSTLTAIALMFLVFFLCWRSRQQAPKHHLQGSQQGTVSQQEMKVLKVLNQ